VKNTTVCKNVIRREKANGTVFFEIHMMVRGEYMRQSAKTFAEAMGVREKFCAMRDAKPHPVLTRAWK